MRALPFLGAVTAAMAVTGAGFHVYVAADLARRGLHHDAADVLPISGSMALLAGLLAGVVLRVATGPVQMGTPSRLGSSALATPIRTYGDVRLGIRFAACAILGPLSLLWGLYDFGAVLLGPGWASAEDGAKTDAVIRTGTGVILCGLGALIYVWELRKARGRSA